MQYLLKSSITTLFHDYSRLDFVFRKPSKTVRYFDTRNFKKHQYSTHVGHLCHCRVFVGHGIPQFQDGNTVIEISIFITILLTYTDILQLCLPATSFRTPKRHLLLFLFSRTTQNRLDNYLLQNFTLLQLRKLNERSIFHIEVEIRLFSMGQQNIIYFLLTHIEPRDSNAVHKSNTKNTNLSCPPHRHLIKQIHTISR